jgi:hypothetical protein
MKTKQKPAGTIRVLAKHIREAMTFADPRDVANCPIALALRDCLPYGTRIEVGFEGVYVETLDGNAWLSDYDRHTKRFLNLWDRYAASWDPRNPKRMTTEEMKAARAKLLSRPPVIQMDWHVA